MKTFSSMFALYLFLLCSVCTAFARESFYVQPFQAKVFAKAAISAEVLGKVASGYQFVATGREGNWMKLSFNGRQGYIPAVQTAKSPPLSKTVVKGAEAAPKLGARARTSSTSAVVAGMKGLTYEDRASIQKGEHTNMEALEKVESLKITSAELEKFLAEVGKK